MSDSYVFDKDMISALYMAQDLSESLPFIPRKVLLISIFLVPYTTLQDKLAKYASKDDILENCYHALSNIKYVKAPNIFSLTLDDDSPSFIIEESVFDIFNWISSNKFIPSVISIDNFMLAYKTLYKQEYIATTYSIFPQISTPANPTPKFEIPSELSSFLTVLNDNFSESDTICPINGRESEIKKLIHVLMKVKKRNAILVGEPGVGKTALIEKLTWMIVTKKCPDYFKNSIVLSLDVNAIIAGTTYRGTAEKRFINLIKFLESHSECILFIDEVHLLLGAGSCNNNNLDLANALKPLLARSSSQVIGATTLDEYEEIFSCDGALKRRFEKIYVDEPFSAEVKSMIKNQVAILEKKHGVSISKKLIDFIILNASCYDYETRNPDRTLDLVDKTLAIAKLHGKRRATRKHVLENFDYNRKCFEKMPESTKLATAFHEAGHYIVHRFSGNIEYSKVLAISIMPTNNYLGINVLETNHDIVNSYGRDFYIKEIATYLAGRIAEKMFTNTLSSGASNDLLHANEIANTVITQFGLEEDFNEYTVFQTDFDASPKSCEINLYVENMLSEAWNYAEDILNQKYDYLIALVNGLMKNGILSNTEIDKIVKNVDLNLSDNTSN